MEETLSTAALRQFAVTCQTKPGLPHPLKVTLLVEAYSIQQAKNEALKKLRRQGPYANRGHDHWKYEVQEWRDQ